MAPGGAARRVPSAAGVAPLRSGSYVTRPKGCARQGGSALSAESSERDRRAHVHTQVTY